MFKLRAPIITELVHRLAGNPMPTMTGGRSCGKSWSSAALFNLWVIHQQAANDPIRPLRYV